LFELFFDFNFDFNKISFYFYLILFTFEKLSLNILSFEKDE